MFFFADSGGKGVKKMVIFCERHKWMIPYLIAINRSQTHGTRSSRRTCSIKIGVLKAFAKFTRKHLCQSLFFNKVTDLRPATLLKKRLRHKCFPLNFAKFLRTSYRTPRSYCFCSTLWLILLDDVNESCHANYLQTTWGNWGDILYPGDKTAPSMRPP